jgi:hypothetical protein
MSRTRARADEAGRQPAPSPPQRPRSSSVHTVQSPHRGYREPLQHMCKCRLVLNLRSTPARVCTRGRARRAVYTVPQAQPYVVPTWVRYRRGVPRPAPGPRAGGAGARRRPPPLPPGRLSGLLIHNHPFKCDAQRRRARPPAPAPAAHGPGARTAVDTLVIREIIYT